MDRRDSDSSGEARGAGERSWTIRDPVAEVEAAITRALADAEAAPDPVERMQRQTQLLGVLTEASERVSGARQSQVLGAMGVAGTQASLAARVGTSQQRVGMMRKAALSALATERVRKQGEVGSQ